MILIDGSNLIEKEKEYIKRGKTYRYDKKTGLYFEVGSEGGEEYLKNRSPDKNKIEYLYHATYMHNIFYIIRNNKLRSTKTNYNRISIATTPLYYTGKKVCINYGGEYGLTILWKLDYIKLKKDGYKINLNTQCHKKVMNYEGLINTKEIKSLTKYIVNTYVFRNSLKYLFELNHQNILLPVGYEHFSSYENFEEYFFELLKKRFKHFKVLEDNNITNLKYIRDNI